MAWTARFTTRRHVTTGCTGRFMLTPALGWRMYNGSRLFELPLLPTTIRSGCATGGVPTARPPYTNAVIVPMPAAAGGVLPAGGLALPPRTPSRISELPVAVPAVLSYRKLVPNSSGVGAAALVAGMELTTNGWTNCTVS